MRIRTAEARLRTRLRAYLRDSGYIDHMPQARLPHAMAEEATSGGDNVLSDNNMVEAVAAVRGKN